MLKGYEILKTIPAYDFSDSRQKNKRGSRKIHKTNVKGR